MLAPRASAIEVATFATSVAAIAITTVTTATIAAVAITPTAIAITAIAATRGKGESRTRDGEEEDHVEDEVGDDEDDEAREVEPLDAFVEQASATLQIGGIGRPLVLGEGVEQLAVLIDSDMALLPRDGVQNVLTNDVGPQLS